jgi:hypothetical protein
MDQEVRLEVTLPLGSTSDTVTVDAVAPLLVTNMSPVGQVIENKAIVNTP